MAMRIIPAASAVIVDEQGRVLLVRRGREPARGRWSVPGGKSEPGEGLAQTAAREAFEETGLRVAVGEELWAVTVPLDGDTAYQVHAFAATVVDGELVAGDDADEASWVTDADLDGLPLTADLAAHLRRAGVFG